MTDMTLQEIRTRRDELAKEFAELVLAFNKETGTVIDIVRPRYIDVSQHDSRLARQILSSVDIELQRI